MYSNDTARGPACTKLLAVHTREGVGSNSQFAVLPASEGGLQTSPANSIDLGPVHMIEGPNLTVMKTTSEHDVHRRLQPEGEGMTRPEASANPFLLHLLEILHKAPVVSISVDPPALFGFNSDDRGALHGDLHGAGIISKGLLWYEVNGGLTHRFGGEAGRRRG